MNENLNLIEILKDCPEGTKLYSPIYGDVGFIKVRLNSSSDYPIEIRLSNDSADDLTIDGRLFAEYNGECMLFPSREQRDWSKFKPKKSKFDPKALKPFDKVLVRDSDETALVVDADETRWKCALYSHERGNEYSPYKYATTGSPYVYCIPYNDDTKHLVGTKEEAPEFYRYWDTLN